MTFQDYLKEINACTDAREWATGKDFKDIYNTCHRGDWLCWLYARTNPSDIRGLTLVKGLQANEIRHLMQDPRSLAAVDAAIAYGRGEINEKQLLASADAAYAASDAAYAAAYASADAAYAYADAAYAASAYVAASASADAAADAAYAAAAYAAYAAAYAAADAAGEVNDVYVKSLRRSADIFRENIPYEKINKVWEIM